MAEIDLQNLEDKIKVLDEDIQKVNELLVKLEKDKVNALATMNALQGAKSQCVTLIKELQKNTNVDVAAHLTLVGKSIDDIDAIIQKLKILNVKTIVAIRGDSPNNLFVPVKKGFINTSDFVAYLKRNGFEVLKFLSPTIDNFKTFFNISINQKLLTKIYFDSKYEVFYDREKKSYEQLNKNKNMNLKNIDFNKIPSLSKEILEKLNKFKPENLYDAGKISGITPSALFQIVKHKKIKGDRVA